MENQLVSRKVPTERIKGSVIEDTFTDITGTYPTNQYTEHNSPDVSSLARSGGSHSVEKSGNTKHVYDYPGGKDPTQDNTDRTPVGPPPPAKASQYPYNDVKQTESGHVQEFDDTPGAERIATTHRSGTYVEYRPDGGFVTHIVGKGWLAVADDYGIVIKGSCQVVIAGDADLRVGGDYNVKVEGNYNLQVEGDFKTVVGGAENIEVYGGAVKTVARDSATIIGGDQSTSIAGDSEHQVAGSIATGALGDIKMSNKGNFTHNSHGSTAIASTGNFSVAGKGTMALKAEGAMSVDSKSSTSLTSDSTTSVVGSQIHLNTDSRSAANVADPEDVPVPTANNIIDLTSNLRTTNYTISKNFSISEMIANNEDDGPDQDTLKIAKQSGVAETYPVSGNLQVISTSSKYQGTAHIPSEDRLGNVRTDNINQPSFAPQPIEPLSGLTTSLSTKLSPNITLAEMSTGAAITHHRVRAQAGQSEDQIISNLSAVAMNILEPLIKHLGSKSFVITSGFRDAKLSKNGVKNSQHNIGQAVDIQFPDKSMLQHAHVAEWIRDNLNYDQCILEYLSSSPIGGWIHISYNGGSNRGSAFTMYNHKKNSDSLIRATVTGNKITSKTVSA